MIKNAQFIEFYSKFIWPAHRLFVKKSKRCKKCIISEKCSPLNSDGICLSCESYSPSIYSDSIDVEIESMHNNMIEMSSIINSKLNDKKYNSLMLFSGGKDSTYVLYRIKKNFPKLRILAVLVNNGFMSQVSINNAKSASAKLDTDLLIVNSYQNKFKEIFRNEFLNLNNDGCYKKVDFADGKTIFDICTNIAKDMNIELMLTGLSYVQAKNIVGIDNFYIQNPKDPTIVMPLCVWKTNEKAIKNTLILNGLIEKNSTSPFVTNSELVIPMCVIDILKIGYCSFEPEFGQLVREGKADRKFWINIFEIMEYLSLNNKLDKQVNKTLSKLDLKIEDIL